MTTVFIGGSRSISRLNSMVIRRLARIIRKRFRVLIGDANGADKAVQAHLKARKYDRVTVFFAENHLRNNLGNWPTHQVPARGKRGYELYAAKDMEMAREATVGFMLWDGESRGTLENVRRLNAQGKSVLLFLSKSAEFLEIRSLEDWSRLSDNRVESAMRASKLREMERSNSTVPTQAPLF